MKLPHYFFAWIVLLVALRATETKYDFELLLPKQIEVTAEELKDGVSLVDAAQVAFLPNKSDYEWVLPLTVDHNGGMWLHPIACEFKLLDADGKEVDFPRSVSAGYFRYAYLHLPPGLTPKLRLASGVTPRVWNPGIYRLRGAMFISDDKKESHWLYCDFTEIRVVRKQQTNTGEAAKR